MKRGVSRQREHTGYHIPSEDEHEHRHTEKDRLKGMEAYRTISLVRLEYQKDVPEMNPNR